MRDFLVIYHCSRVRDSISSPTVIRAISETDPINAVIAARVEERKLVGMNCPDCVLVAVAPAS
jgi:hypothetical protein